MASAELLPMMKMLPATVNVPETVPDELEGVVGHGGQRDRAAGRIGVDKEVAAEQSHRRENATIFQLFEVQTNRMIAHESLSAERGK